MTQTVAETVSYPSNFESIKKLKFAENTEFRATLNRRVDDFFKTTGRQKRDCPQMYLKTAILVLGLIAIYVSLVFLAQEWWQALSLSILLGLFMDGIAFNLQHDGSHNAYSNIPWVNKLMAMSMDVIGFSSYYWKILHNVLHHNYVNITGYDQDFEFGTLARKTPFQKWFPHHRWQQYYIWLLYGVYSIEWSLSFDFENFFSNKLRHVDYPRPKERELVIFILGKTIFLSLAFGIPLMFHSIWNILLCYTVTQLTLGIVMSCIFWLAHEVEEAEFPMPSEDTGMVENEWAIHQIETSVNCSFNPFLNWFCGGLNFQIEHHLFPKICHVNYASIALIVEKTCQEFGVKYQTNKSLFASLSSHFRLLRRLGKSSSTL